MLRQGLKARSNTSDYTTFSFHLPRTNTAIAMTASSVSEITTAQNTPSGPNPYGRAISQASGICTSQKQIRLSQVGVIVSPAPLKAFAITIPHA